ncbi:caspase family protein [Pseudarthrobacter siccitolerans]|nr:caspase family protein [Pseudarthrobacter siccitolerans]
MMIDAASTWALVVGIDTYDSKDVPDLAGAARDAGSAVTWLKSLGVPDEKILLHVAPSNAAKSEIDSLGLAYLGCREPEIWTSFEKLMDNSGSRLFVFLSGHGLWEPAGERVFLTQEANKNVMKNLGIDWYARLLRGLPFSKQFIIMDGCLNAPYSAAQRSTFEAGKQSSVKPKPERADVDQWFCYGAAVNQRSIEDDGRGLFSRELLATLDPGRRDQRCLIIDDSTGATALDLQTAVNDIVSPNVSAKASSAFGRRQTPGMQMLSGGAARKSVSVAEFAPTATASISINIEPREALPEISRVTLSFDDFYWQRRVPSPPDVSVPNVFHSVLPPGLRMQVRCSMIAGANWRQPAQQDIDTDQDREVRFIVERLSEGPSGGAGVEPDPAVGYLTGGERVPRTEINTVAVDGGVVGAMSSAEYDHVREIIDRNGGRIDLEEHETGPVLYSVDRDEGKLREVTLSIASKLSQVLSPGIGARVRGVDTQQMTSTVSLVLSKAKALSLGGLLQHRPVIYIGDDASRSLADLRRDPVVTVDPGPVMVRMTLPWGTWIKSIVVHPNQSVDVELPKSVGVPPLRVLLLKSTRQSDAGPAYSVVTLRTPTIPEHRGPDESTVAFALAESSTWRSNLWLAPSSAMNGWTSLGSLPRRSGSLMFPLNRNGAVAVQAGKHPRAEPLSIVDSPHWDRLVSSGLLEDITPDEAVNLTNDKWFDPLLGLAGGYACFAQHMDNYARIVLENLLRIDETMPDVTILMAALDRRAGSKSTNVRARLARLLDDGAVPLFGWGVALGALAARHFGLGDLAARYEEISRSLIEESTWTLWVQHD